MTLNLNISGLTVLKSYDTIHNLSSKFDIKLLFQIVSSVETDRTQSASGAQKGSFALVWASQSGKELYSYL